MNITKFKYFFLDAVKNLKRNSTITAFSVITVSATLFIVGLFLLYLLSVDKNFATLFVSNSINRNSVFIDNKEMVIVFKWLEVAAFFVLPVISLFLVVTSFKMSILQRRNEINIMKFVGATNWFIRWPFIIEGLIIGIVGAFFGNVLLFFIYDFVYTKALEFIPELTLVQPAFITNVMLWPFVIGGTFLGAIGSIIALRKFLDE
ncbi:FtsX-like permease family protein [Clostridium beijerinckii]|uniref:Cell division protein FtsX n=1 Tax=Clostridium beijerinckii TaxID=1520 RepID=A0A1S8S2A9_CLOBE|nr:FtsX-like permease family protein [Clostridium beijerinckii]NRY58938.1 cell division transport system permease protein [Clostridium beijerinckii]OOM59583.1 cell division protein FtsX [Clostridium beijerinckii]